MFSSCFSYNFTDKCRLKINSQILISIFIKLLVAESEFIAEFDEPSSYPSSPDTVLINQSMLSDGNQHETPPPRYSQWYSDGIFKEALRNKMRNES
jgi:hypothetical protein